MFLTVLTPVLSAIAVMADTTEDENLNQMVNAASAAGFLVAGLIALVAIFLGIDMVRRIRRARYREQVRAELEPELERMKAEEKAESDTAKSDDEA